MALNIVYKMAAILSLTNVLYNILQCGIMKVKLVSLMSFNPLYEDLWAKNRCLQLL